MAEMKKRRLDSEDVDSFIQAMIHRAVNHAQKIADNDGTPRIIPGSNPRKIEAGLRVFDEDDDQDGLHFLVNENKLNNDLKNASEKFQNKLDDRFGRDEMDSKKMALIANHIYEANR
jgi:hypothetical protein